MTVSSAFKSILGTQRCVVAEYTSDQGPYLDDFFLCLAYEDGETHEWVRGDSHRQAQVMAEIEEKVGGPIHQSPLNSSADYATRILYPPELVNSPYYDFDERSPTKDEMGFLGRLFGVTVIDRKLSREVMDYLGWEE